MTRPPSAPLQTERRAAPAREGQPTSGEALMSETEHAAG